MFKRRTDWLIASQETARTVCLTDTTVSALLGLVVPSKKPNSPCTVDIGWGRISWRTSIMSFHKKVTQQMH